MKVCRMGTHVPATESDRISPTAGFGKELAQQLTPRALVALVDLGMWNDQIAVYFGVEPEKVTALRKYYGL